MPDVAVPAPPAPVDNQPTVILVLGILGLVGCQVLGPIAWSMGTSYERRCRTEGRTPDQMAVIGKVLGMVSTALLAFGLIMFIVVFGLQICLGLAMVVFGMFGALLAGT